MITTKQLDSLLESLKLVYGYDFTEYAQASVLRRVDHYIKINKIAGIDDLGRILLQDDKRFAHFVEEFTVNVTEMFRDPSFYKSLRDNVMKRLATYPFIKVWIAGCSTGEEIYSIAILLKEEGLLDRSVIYATDINQKALQAAKKGLFHLDLMKRYTVNYQKSGGKNSFSDYYIAKYDSALLDKSLRSNIVFAPHNLAVDTSFNEFQLILCRNVLIYFNQNLQNRAISLFYESLCPFGILALGSKESLLFSDKRKRFNEVDRREKIFIKES
jgi:chemotaxis protein methyltransferase CheR